MALVNYVQDIPRTSDIEFFSSLHGREKREERGINKRDLQEAVKYGKKAKAHPDRKTGATRWMYTLGKLVYITDETSTCEITSYRRQPMPLAGLTPGDIFDHERAKDHLRRNPNLCTSHTVIVVDHSASMSTQDVMDHANRIKASFGMLALDFVGKRMLSGEASATDVVSVMLMHDGVDVLFEREPMGRVLYNRFVDIHGRVKPRSHGNFLPSLEQAEKLLRNDCNQPGTALCLMFLSDGRPSDNATGVRGSCEALSATISDRVGLLSANFRRRLSVATVGFASRDQDFPVLEAMAEAARSAGAKGDFYRPELSSAGLASAISSTVSTLTATKSHLSTTVMAPPAARGRRALPPIQEVQKESAECDDADGWKVYVGGIARWEYVPFSRPSPLSPLPCFDKLQLEWQETGPRWPTADGIAIRKLPFGEGAERMVFKMQEYDSRRDALVGDLIVAKCWKGSSGPENDSAAETAAKLQAKVMTLSDAFNREVQECLARIPNPHERNGRVDRRVWVIEFLACSIYRFFDGDLRKFILAEKMLDPRAYAKWNGNNGYVFRGRGQSSLPMLSTDAQKAASEAHVDGLMDEPPRSGGDNGDVFEEGNDGDFSEELIDFGTGAEDYMRGELIGSGCGSRKRKRVHQHVLQDFRPRPTDYLQAFSHFSYAHTDRKMLVCDLQGVRSYCSPDNLNRAGRFELTDPVIHYQSHSRKQVYGRTDLGREGMRKFFRTHVCNDVCRLLGLGTRSPASKAVPTAFAGNVMPMAIAGNLMPKAAAGKAAPKAANKNMKAAKGSAKATKGASKAAKGAAKAPKATPKPPKAIPKAAKKNKKAAKGAAKAVKGAAKAANAPANSSGSDGGGHKAKRRKVSSG